MLSVRNYMKKYGSQTILSIEELNLGQGLFWIKGENGSGKTTLFRSLAGIIPCQGEIAVKNINLKSRPVAYRKYVNYSEAEPIYPSFLTAMDIVCYVGKAKNSSASQQQALTSRLGISSFLHQESSTFSSGMLKKLSLTLAFLGSPSTIILDEPFTTLDEASRKNLVELIIEKRESDVQFLISSHQTLDQYDLPVTKTFTLHHQTVVEE